MTGDENRRVGVARRKQCVRVFAIASDERITMNKPFTTIAVMLLAFGALLQLLRFIQGWEVTVNGMTVPVWVSGIACLVLGGLALMVWRERVR